MPVGAEGRGMTNRVDRLRDGVARLAARIAERRAQQLAKEEAITRVGAGREAGAEEPEAPQPPDSAAPGARITPAADGQARARRRRAVGRAGRGRGRLAAAGAGRAPSGC